MSDAIFYLDDLIGEFEKVPNTNLPDPDLLQHYLDFKAGHLWLDYDITYENCATLVKQLQFLDRVDTDEPITLHIVSDGGDANVMFLIYDVLKNMRRKVITINESSCHSAAFLIFLGGKERRMRKFGAFIVHEGSAQFAGTHKQISSATKDYKRSIKIMKKVICEETKISTEVLEEHFGEEEDWHIDYETAKELGIITHDIDGNPVADQEEKEQ